MTWSTKEIEYEGLPLLLRRPNHTDVWNFKRVFSKLISIEHHLAEVLSNGLPESVYNESLADFDNHMCNLLHESDNGIALIIETFSGKRNYYYYVRPRFQLECLVEAVRSCFNVDLTAWEKKDPEWSFLETYPIEIFPK